MAVLGGRCVRDGASQAEWQREGAARPFLAAVLDGLGGHQSGDKASARVAERLAATAWRWAPDCSAEELTTGLTEALIDAHRELNDLGRLDQTLAGSGTTCTAMLVAANALLLVHVGDTRCYRRRDGVWKLLTVDHVVLLPDGSGQAIPRLTFAVGADLPMLPPDLVTDLSEMSFPGDVYLLVTDGVVNASGSEQALEAALEATDAAGVLERALAQGGPDNATAVRLELIA
jgi:PPM family protein phosphatase